MYILSRKGDKIVRSSNVRFDERKGLVIEGEREEEQVNQPTKKVI